MKYIVMQCCKGYAVLMDEEGKFVFAANLGYEVGQTVTNPVIMSEQEKKNRSSITMFRAIAAAAACIGIISIPCYGYYAKNLKTCSTVTLTSDTAISMNLNSSGKVISLESDTEYGKNVIEKIDIKGKDKVEAANEILQAEISDGYLSGGDTIDVYIASQNTEDYNTFKSELESELPKLDIKVNVHDKKSLKDKITIKDKNRDKNNDKTENSKPAAPETPTQPVTEAVKNEAPITPPKATKPVAVPKPPVHDDKTAPEIPSAPSELPTAPVVNENEQNPHRKPDKSDHRLPHQNNDEITTEPATTPVPHEHEDDDDKISHQEKAHQQKQNGNETEKDIVAPLITPLEDNHILT